MFEGVESIADGRIEGCGERNSNADSTGPLAVDAGYCAEEFLEVIFWNSLCVHRSNVRNRGKNGNELGTLEWRLNRIVRIHNNISEAVSGGIPIASAG